jgi:hypothetical protein
MNLPRRHFLHLAAGTVALPATLRVARAQIYPTRPVTIIDAFAPGGTTDASARIIGQHMSRTPLNLTYVAHSEYLAGRTPPVCLRARPFSRAEGAAVRVATCTPAAAPWRSQRTRQQQGGLRLFVLLPDLVGGGDVPEAMPAMAASTRSISV